MDSNSIKILCIEVVQGTLICFCPRRFS